MRDELLSFIDKVYREPYRFRNNCIHKSLKIKARAEKLEEEADLILCLDISRIRKLHNFPIISPHVFLKINGEKIDVAFDPSLEGKVCRNGEKKILMPLNISRIGRALFPNRKAAPVKREI